MLIEKVLKRMRVADTVHLGNAILDELGKSTIEDVNITAIKSEMSTICIGLAGAVNETKVLSMLEKYDTLRDNTYRSLLYLNKGFLLHPDTKIRAAASEVQQVLDKYGFSLVDHNYASESTLIDAFIRDMKMPLIAPNVSVLPGLPAILSQLQTDQDLFKSAERSWHEARAEDGKTLNATALKHELMKVINDKLVLYLRAMVQLNPASFGELSNNISMHISTANELVKRRSNSEEEVEIDN
ncbi:hypothetical protein KEM09_06045 [Carboxylicivirga mesophila]|uniref:Uncharacterized protein n=1 Tax=Carboxylicivirga mesophila TaxID=1166478 RepID=A0ABS5K7H4_9BACT|nr:DUF6261 family protein [Carboxylicivirga mesophila]MBS2210951.1 hypothetical protein [Carboxylicivirga mesophila]